MLSSPNIDIIIPIFNHVEYIEQAVSIACVQTYSPASIICINNGSTDLRVSPLLKALADKDSRIKLISLVENVGICGAQQIGLEASNSAFIAFLDCDDWLEPEALARVADAISRDPQAHYLFSDRNDVDKNGEFICRRRYGGQPHLIGNPHADNLLEHMVASHLKVISREALLSVGGFVIGTEGVQDWDIALKISERYDLSYIPLALYNHRIHSGAHTVYANSSNIQKVNNVRRAAQMRRFGRRSIKGSPRIPTMLHSLICTVPELADRLFAANGLLVLEKNQGILHVPLIEEAICDILEGSEVVEVAMSFAEMRAANILRLLWTCNLRPRIGFMLDSKIHTSAIYRARWFNSYFDYLYCRNLESYLSTLLCFHDNLELFYEGQSGNLVTISRSTDLQHHEFLTR